MCPSVVLGVAACLFVAVHSLLEFESSVSSALLFVAPTANPLFQQQQKRWHLLLPFVWFIPSYFATGELYALVEWIPAAM